MFIKGTGNLLAGIYVDIAEGMMGTTNFIIDKNQISLAKIIL
jgi:hypothetical protein